MKPGDRYAMHYGPILDALRDLGGSGTAKEVRSLVIERGGFSADELAKVHPSGEPIIENNIDWARNTLKEAGLLDPSERGIWKLTQEGWRTKLTLEQARELRRKTNREWAQRKKFAAEQGEDIENSDGVEGIERATALRTLRTLSSDGFERFCQLLLRESGFTEVHVTGKSGDGGIDGHGTLQVNELVSFRVMFQCKRYAKSVSPDLIRDFRGAMQGRSEKGIFITTGYFTAQAEAEANRDGPPPIELVDGDRLVELMERLKLGLIPRTIFDVDEKFFDEYR